MMVCWSDFSWGRDEAYAGLQLQVIRKVDRVANGRTVETAMLRLEVQKKKKSQSGCNRCTGAGRRSGVWVSRGHE